jgi:hypothetical protein
MLLRRLAAGAAHLARVASKQRRGLKLAPSPRYPDPMPRAFAMQRAVINTLTG